MCGRRLRGMRLCSSRIPRLLSGSTNSARSHAARPLPNRYPPRAPRVTRTRVGPANTPRPYDRLAAPRIAAAKRGVPSSTLRDAPITSTSTSRRHDLRRDGRRGGPVEHAAPHSPIVILLSARARNSYSKAGPANTPRPSPDRTCGSRFAAAKRVGVPSSTPRDATISITITSTSRRHDYEERQTRRTGLTHSPTPNIRSPCASRSVRRP